MKRTSFHCIKVLISSVFLGLVVISSAQAIPCLTPASDGVSDATACVNGSGNNDFVSNPLAVNTQMLHGHNDWVYLQKQNFVGALETNIDVDFVATSDNGGADSSGEWSFASAVWDLYEDVMIVLKTGNTGPPQNIFWAAYLLDNSVEPNSGDWSTGDGITNGSGKDISHITLYARGTPSDMDMPEPSTALLLLLVLGGLSLRQKMLMSGARS